MACFRLYSCVNCVSFIGLQKIWVEKLRLCDCCYSRYSHLLDVVKIIINKMELDSPWAKIAAGKIINPPEPPGMPLISWVNFSRKQG